MGVYLVVDDEHVPEDLVELLRPVGVLLAFEEGNEDVVLPVVIQPVLLLVDLVDLEDGRRLEGPQPALHEGEELVLHLRREVLIRDLVIPQEESLELAGVELVDPLFDLGVELLPKLLVCAL